MKGTKETMYLEYASRCFEQNTHPQPYDEWLKSVNKSDKEPDDPLTKNKKMKKKLIKLLKNSTQGSQLIVVQDRSFIPVISVDVDDNGDIILRI